jgi:predicted lipid-binding transport protein (Tim44 family)
MAKNDWKAKALTKEGFDLEKLVNQKFMKYFSEQFKDKTVEVTGISLFISDKNIDREENRKEFDENSASVVISYSKIEDTENKKITLRVSEDSEIEKILKAIELFEGSL